MDKEDGRNNTLPDDQAHAQVKALGFVGKRNDVCISEDCLGLRRRARVSDHTGAAHFMNPRGVVFMCVCPTVGKN